MKLLLTSCGLETGAIQAAFLKLLPKVPEDIQAVFVPTAAIDADAIEVLPKCLHDLLKCGIKREHITVYDLHVPMDLAVYDVIYFCGGDPLYLLNRINETSFRQKLLQFIKGNGVFLGVSAGSIVAARNLDGNLGLLDCSLNVHCEQCDQAGSLDLSIVREINLGNRQAVVMTDRNRAEIVE